MSVPTHLCYHRLPAASSSHILSNLTSHPILHWIQPMIQHRGEIRNSTRLRENGSYRTRKRATTPATTAKARAMIMAILIFFSLGQLTQWFLPSPDSDTTGQPHSHACDITCHEITHPCALPFFSIFIRSIPITYKIARKCQPAASLQHEPCIMIPGLLLTFEPFRVSTSCTLLLSPACVSPQMRSILITP